MAVNVIYRFGAFALDPAAYRLTRGAESIALSPKALDLLLLFVQHPSALLTKDEIFRRLWPDVAVTDNALTQVVSELRQALGDVPAQPTFLQTVSRRGYRFVAPVEIGVSDPAGGTELQPRPSPSARTGQRSIVVLDFTNVTGDSEMSWLRAGIAETITNDLRAIREFRVLDRLPAFRSEGDPIAEAARAADVDLVVVGSFQSAGDQLRITSRVVDVGTREALAHAKADGPLSEVFATQDAIVTQLAAGLKMTMTSAATARIHARETSSLDAYRSLTEGRLRLESLDPALIPDAIADFEKALAGDPGYALAHVGLAHAKFWQFQASRARAHPDRAQLAAAIGHARRAVEIDAELAEGHSALAFFLASADRPREAIAAGRLAVSLEPGNWRHQFRLGIAAWGSERVEALDAVIRWFPRLAYAYFHVAMVHIARGDLARAMATLDTGLAQMDGGQGPRRFPASGLHWLRGLVCLSQGDAVGACSAFDRELASTGGHLFADEFAMDACDGHGFARLAAGDASGAAAMFTQALTRMPRHAKSMVGLADASARLGNRDRAAALLADASTAINDLIQGERHAEAAMARAYSLVVGNDQVAAVQTLLTLLEQAPPGPAGWTLPVEPWLASLRSTPAGRTLMAVLASRAA